MSVDERHSVHLNNYKLNFVLPTQVLQRCVHRSAAIMLLVPSALRASVILVVLAELQGRCASTEDMSPVTSPGQRADYESTHLHFASSYESYVTMTHAQGKQSINESRDMKSEDFEITTKEMEGSGEVGSPDVRKVGAMTEEQYNHIEFVCTRVLQPIITILGIAGNALSLVVFSNPKSKIRFSTKVYLKALCAADFIYLTLSLYDHLVEYTFHINPRTLSQITAYGVKYVRPFTMCFAGTSSFIVVVISIERLTAICFPLWAGSSGFNRYPGLPIGIAALLNVTVATISILCFQPVEYYDPSTNQMLWRIVRTPFAQNGNFLKIFGIVAEVVYRLVAVILVMACNMCTVVTLYIASKRRKKLTQGVVPSTSSSESQATRMLLGVAFLFLFCVLPSFTRSLLGFLHPEWKLAFLYRGISEVVNVLTKINSAANLVVYVLASASFRSSLINIICHRETPAKPVTELSMAQSVTKLPAE